MKVLKFGGTSVGRIRTLRQIGNIVEEACQTHRLVIVVSALSGVTDALIRVLEGAQDIDDFLQWMRLRHLHLAESLLEQTYTAYIATLDAQQDDLRCLYQQLETLPEGSDAWVAQGEYWSVALVSACLQERRLSACPVDAAPLVALHTQVSASPMVDVELTRERIRQWYQTWPAEDIPVVTGFVGRTQEGVLRTLGRGGSDYTAALFAAALEAEVLERWTDVDGLYTTDPRKHASARKFTRLYLEDAHAFNRAGKLGMHREMLAPLMDQGIPVHVRCTSYPEREGTWIYPSTAKKVAV